MVNDIFSNSSFLADTTLSSLTKFVENPRIITFYFALVIANYPALKPEKSHPGKNSSQRSTSSRLVSCRLRSIDTSLVLTRFWNYGV